MATEADMPESITITKREGEITYPGSGRFDGTADETFSGELKKFQGVLNVPPDTVEYLGETKDMQAANDFGAEAMNVIKFNVETAGGERFLGPPSVVQVSIEDTFRVSKNSEPEEVTLQAGNEAPENGKQTQNTSNIEVAGERGIEENEVTEDSQEKPVEDKSNEKETSDIHNYEKDGTMTGINTDLGSNDEVVNVLEAASDRDKEDLIHIPDPTVIGLNKSVETVIEPCMKNESATEVKFTGEEMRETGSTEAEKSSILTDEEPEATKPSEGVADENEEKEKSTYEGAEDIFTSTDVSGVYEAGPEESAKLKEASSILCEEKSQDEIEPSKDIMNSSTDTPAMQIEGKDIIKESPEEVNEQIEMTEKTAGKDYESPDQKGDGSIMKDEDTSSITEVLPAKEASSGGNRYDEESTVTATRDEIIDAFEQTQSGMTNHEDRLENLQQEKPEKPKLEGSLNLLAEEFNKAAETEQAEAITSVKEETHIKSHEESLDKEMKIDLPHHTDAVSENAIPKNKNVGELDEKTECAEVEAQNKNANDLHDIPVLDEEAGETEGKDLEKVFKTEPKGTSQKANDAYTEEEEKHIEDAPEACQRSNSTIIEQTSLEGAESTELIPKASETDEKKLQEASGLDFHKTSVIMDNGENTDQEMQKIGEACDTMTEEILANSVDVETSVDVNNAVFLRDEKAEQNIQVERSPLEVAPELIGQDESCIAGDTDKRNNITHEEVHDGTKITDSVVAIDEQVIEGNVAHISAESIEKPNVVSSEGNVAESSEGENDIEQVTEDSSIRFRAPESVEEGPVKNLEEESTGEIPEKSDTAEAMDSIGQETSENKEIPKEIVDDSKVKGDTLLTGGRNQTPTQTLLEEKRNEDTTPAMVAEESGDDSEPADVKDDNRKKTSKTVEDVNPISQKNEPEEEFPQSLSTISDKNEAFNSDADKFPGDVGEGPTQKLEEALQLEENEKAEMKNDTEYSKTAPEEASVELETTSASEVAENQTVEMEKNVDRSREVEEKKTEESIQEDENVAEISEQGNDTYISQVSGEFEEGKSKKTSQEDEKVPEVSKQGNDTYVSSLSIEKETLENTEGNIHKEKKSEGENNGHHDIEESNSRGLIPESESVEQSPVKNLENDKTEEDKSAGEIFDNSEALGAAESTVHKTSSPTESTTEILDPSQMKHGDSSQNEENQLTAVEPSGEDKRNEDRGLAIVAEENSNENELLPVKDNSENKQPISQEDSKHILQENEQSLSVRSNENGESLLDADKSPCLMEVGTQDLNETPWKEGNDKDTEEKNDTENNQIAIEENLEINAEPSDASKTTESAVSELKSEKDQMLVQDEIKKEESEELYEDSNDGIKNEKEYRTTDKLPEPIGEESLQSSKEEETPENQASVELRTISGSEDSEKQTLKVEKTADQSREVEEEEIQQSSQEDDTVAGMSKQGNDTYIMPVSIEKEIFETFEGIKVKEEKAEGENSREQNVEEGNTGNRIPESVDQSPVQNLEDDRMREDKSTREIFENSKTSGAAEIAAHETSTAIDSITEILDNSLVKQVDSEQHEENSQTATESSAKEKINEDRGPGILAEENSNDNEPIGAKDNIEKKSSIGKEDFQHIQQENEPEGKHESLSFVMSDENEAFSSNADKSPSLMEVETSRDLDEAPQKEDNDKETEEKIDTEGNKIADEENHEIVAESSDASKSTDILDLKSEEEKMLVHDEIKEEVSKELYEDTKNAEICDTEDIAQHSKKDASSSLVEGGLIENNSKEDESTDMQSKDKVDESISFVEETGAASSAEETVCTTLKVRAAESNVDSCPSDITKDSEAETQINETNGSLIEVPVRVSQMSNKETEEEIKEKEETTIDDSDSAPITVAAEAEPEEKKQVESFGHAFEEKGMVETETKMTVLESVDINVKPEKASNLAEKSNNEIPAVADNAGETTGGLIQESAMVSHISNKETEEEIKEIEDTNIEDSDSVSATVVTEAQGLQEAEPEEQKQVESFCPAFKENDIAETETKGTMLESVDMNMKPEHTSDLGEKRDREIPKVADEDREIIDCKIQNDAPHAGNEDQTEETTNEKPLEEISKDGLKEYSTIKSKENELTTAGAIESVNKPSAQDEFPNEKTETARVAQAMDETFVNKQDNTTNPIYVSDLESVDIKKEAANEEVQKHEIEDLYVHPELENAKNLSMSEDVEITKGEVTGKLADQGDICKLTTSKDLVSSNLELQMEKTEDGKPFDEVLKTSETSGICTPTEKGILEEEIFKPNLKEGVEVEDTGIEQKGEALKEELEAAENQTSKKFAESEKSQVENSSYNQNQEDDKETMEKEEPQLEVEDHKEQNANETTTAVILTEKDGVEQSDDSEDIKEMITEEECVNGYNDALSTVGEKTDEMNNSIPVCRENNKAADLKEKTKTENPDIGEDSAREGESSFAKESEEQKVQDTSIELSAKDLKGNIGGIIEEPQDCYCKIDNASLTVETDKSSGKVEIDEKLVKAFHIDSDEPSLEATETEKCQEGKEVCSLRLEETSESLMNDSGHAERQCVTIENGDADEPEESKVASEESKSRNAEEAEVGKSQTVDIRDQVPIDNDDHAAVENPGLGEIEETKIVANEDKEVFDSVYESKDQVTEEAEVEENRTVENPNKVPPNDDDDDDDAERQNAAMENSGSDEAEETKIVSNDVDETKDQVSKETAENGTSSTMEKMDHTPSRNFEHAQKESVAVENPNADEANEIKVASDATDESNERDNGESAGEIPTVEKLDQAPAANSEPVQYSNAEEVEKSKIASILASKSKEQSTEDIDVTGENTTEEKPDAENTEEACEAASDYRAQTIEPVTENEITTDQTPSAEKTNAQLPTSTSTLAPKHEATITVEKIEEEKQQKVETLEDEGPEDSSADKPTEEVCLQVGPRELEVPTLGSKINKDIEDSPTEAYKEEGHTPDGALEPWGIENKIKCTDASSESKALQSEAVIHSQEEVTESEDTKIKEKHLIEVISELRTEENQCKKTTEGNEITETEVSKEEITEEKEVEKTCQPVSICEEGMNKSLEDDGQKAEECRGDEANNAFKTTVNEIQYEELLEETKKASASLNIGRWDAAEDIIVEDSHQVSEENMIAKEGCPNEFEGKEAGDSAIKLDANARGEESNYRSGKAEATTPENEEFSMAMSQIESIGGFATGSKIIQEASELEQSSCAITEKQIPTEADLIECPYTPVQTGNEFAPKLEQQGTTETPQEAKTNVEGEQQPHESGEKTTEESALMDSATALLTNLVQGSRIETTKVAEHVDKEREPTGSTEENQTKEPEAIHVEDAKMDEEQDGDEHKRIDSSSDAPIMIEATRDVVDVKVAHKKSHNILSGVGSKVKHSISKVKKAITGKSSHPKPVSPK